ncbi:DUF808 domain-containing protein [Vibrio hippocampi]|uniref:Inner membrane protein YedI n=1 Tax=Vibrio hippocampi TaxID=654686 RepID=A0ABN8DPD9_9VIBR|nr:DUF808 domain-containing protein [Vibrio hippocampi]CAH0530081.1 Inner membrane protein YedI [Vibrio hippocampi]
MAGLSLLTLLDDITAVLDDVALLTKVAAKKTAGVLGDDLALNAHQVSGVTAERELPVVWAVAKGSLKNKCILVPAALLISFIAPWLINPLLLLGGLFLCFEGAEKILEKWFHHESDKEKAPTSAQMSEQELKEYEKKKIAGAIRTDFILSAEIIVIALGTVQGQVIATQIIVVSLIALVMTIGVYGLVAGIVKLDDAGIYLVQTANGSGFKHSFGTGLITFAPKLMKTLTIVGTAAMFLVGGGIVVHNVPFIHHLVAPFEVQPILSIMVNGLTGLLAGLCVVAVVTVISKVTRKHKTSS